MSFDFLSDSCGEMCDTICTVWILSNITLIQLVSKSVPQANQTADPIQ